MIDSAWLVFVVCCSLTCAGFIYLSLPIVFEAIAKRTITSRHLRPENIDKWKPLSFCLTVIFLFIALLGEVFRSWG